MLIADEVIGGGRYGIDVKPGPIAVSRSDMSAAREA